MTFIEQLAKELYQKHGNDISELTIVFPSRRAGLFFRRALSALTEVPIWSPGILGVEEFFRGLSKLEVPDPLVLNFLLYEINTKVMGASEPLDKFLPWGELLLKDFDDIDKYLVNPEKVFTTVAQQKEIDLLFDYLSESQKDLIRSFWERFGERESKQKTDFLKIWKKLPEVYKQFNQRLKKDRLAYNGLLQHEVCKQLDVNKLENPYNQVVFAGFYALTPAEEKVITYFIQHHNADIHWDFDNYYVKDKRQEAGRFIREHLSKSAFEQSLKEPWPDNFAKIDHLEVIATPFQIGQTKRVGEILQQMSTDELEKTVIVIPDEQMLFPTLYALPDTVQRINITMGYPFRNSPLYNLIDKILQLQLNMRVFGEDDVRFYHKQVSSILKHPYLVDMLGAEAVQIVERIERYNQIFVRASTLHIHDIARLIFSPIQKSNQFFDYLREILLVIGDKSSEDFKENITTKEFIYQAIRELNKLETIIANNRLELNIQDFYRLSRQILRSIRVPFDGEPLQGLQIMGVLETRNLDFDTVLFLGLNEGLMPATGGLHSYIPYNLRRAFELPTFDQQDSIYAYLFYRLIQRTKKAYLFYNSEVTQRISGEPSRYIQQLRIESGLNIKETVLANPVHLQKKGPILIEKSANVMQSLIRFLKSSNAYVFTPTTLSTYLDCRLRFYFKYLLKIKEPDILEEEIDNRIFGNILHKALEKVYEEFFNIKKVQQVEKEDFKLIKSLVKVAVDAAFKEQFHVDDEAFQYEGRNIVIFEMVKKMVIKILQFDQQYAPFEIMGLEVDKYQVSLPIEFLGNEEQVIIKGSIDRVDKKDNTVRIIDYKTGKDNRKFSSIESLFDRNDKQRNKAAMQTLLYSFVYFRSEGENTSAIKPGLFNAREMFHDGFEPGLFQITGPRTSDLLNDARHLFEAYEIELNNLIQEIMDNKTPFDQTNELKKCTLCPYKEICDR